SPVKERKDSSDSEDDQPASKVLVTAGTEGASDAQAGKGKEPVVSTIATDTPKRKRAGKERIENVEDKKKEKVTKKQ
ncbi:hypothetical protein A2U01_0098111, partial [Trifolium medium]|nr:hypothetical protein [Trifolium medium]